MDSLTINPQSEKYFAKPVACMDNGSQKIGKVPAAFSVQPAKDNAGHVNVTGVETFALHTAFDPSLIERWEPARFEPVKKVQDALRNQGQVHLMYDTTEKRRVAVKQMPNTWIGCSHDDFLAMHPKETELPWQDIGCNKLLNSMAFPYGCTLLGVYRDDENTEVVTTYATEGDLFSWCSSPKSLSLSPGVEREDYLRPLVVQLLSSVKQLHELNIVHRDISMENILLSEVGAEEGQLTLQIIDFGMSSTARYFQKCVRGKCSYQAPEIHENDIYDAFLSDAFSVGVTIYAVCFKDYPWISTKPGGCKCFQYHLKQGFRAYANKRKLRNTSGTVASQTSEDLLRLLEGLLHPDPSKRLTLGERAWRAECVESERRSIWEEPWLRGAKPDPPLLSATAETT